MHEKPEDLIEKVLDEESFLLFVQSLGIDWEAGKTIEEKFPSKGLMYGPGPLGWENGSIGTFLDAASACGLDNLSSGGVTSHTNPWRRAAEILLAGKYYE